MSTVTWITARGLFGRSRFLMLLPLPLVLIGLAVLCRSLGVDPGQWGPPVLVGLGLAVVLPVVALLNFAVFIWPEVHYLRQRTQYQASRKTVQFRQAQQRAQQAQQVPYHHKCAVCGRTDTDYPDLQFRYCSKCAGYHCFCQDHIFTHVHFTE